MREILDRDAILTEASKQATCSHVRRSGGNDYLLCEDCDLMWDYRREGPHDALIRKLLTLLDQGQREREVLKAEVEHWVTRYKELEAWAWC